MLKKLNLFSRCFMLLILLVANTLTPLADMMVVTADTIATTRELKIKNTDKGAHYLNIQWDDM